MAEFASGFGGAAGGEEFVFGPEGAADENGVCTGGELGPFAGAAGEAGSDKNLFAVLFEKESDGRLIGRRGAKEIVSDVVRIGAAQRDRGVEESRGVTRIVRKMAADAPSGGKGLPPPDPRRAKSLGRRFARGAGLARHRGVRASRMPRVG